MNLSLRKGVQSILKSAYQLTVPRQSETTEKSWSSIGWRDFLKPNWFQLSHDKPTTREAMGCATVYTCIAVLGQETSRLDIHHWDLGDDQSRTQNFDSAAARVMRKPNTYQSRSDWLLYLMQSLLLSGNSYHVVERDGRNAVKALHPVHPDCVQILRVDENYEIFYQVTLGASTGNTTATRTVTIPQRDMLHIRVFTQQDLLIGMSPLTSLGPSVAMNQNIQNQSASFFGNMSRPSGILRSPKVISIEAANRLRDQWAAATSGEGVGRTPVLDNDFDWKPLTMSAVDAEVIAHYRMSVETIAQVYRVPLFMLGDLTKATLSNVEGLQKAFIMSALGFYLKHIENALDDLFFDSAPKSYVEFDLERGLLRPDLEQRMAAYAKGVLGGIYAPNEPRKRENLPPVEGGERVYMQKQNWPLDMLGEDAENEAVADTPNDSSDEDPPDDPDDEDDQLDEESARAILRGMAA